jgi:pyridoxamine 5'-phosphate oxidase
LTDLPGRLRAVRVFDGALPAFDPAVVPDDPVRLFVDWMVGAIDAGVQEPHVAILSTVDDQGHPDARALILKDVDQRGWWFASGSTGPKGTQLASHPWAALTWYWPGQARQIRVRGEVHEADADVSAQDFLARAPGGRAEALVGRQSEPLADQAELAEALADAEAGIAENPDLVAKDWTRYVLRADEVQFFQGSPDRMHTRVGYTRTGNEWTHTLLWP